MNSIEAVAGETVYIPCNLTIPDTTDNVSLILWYRQDKGTPVYRYVPSPHCTHIMYDIPILIIHTLNHQNRMAMVLVTAKETDWVTHPNILRQIYWNETANLLNFIFRCCCCWRRKWWRCCSWWYWLKLKTDCCLTAIPTAAQRDNDVNFVRLTRLTVVCTHKLWIPKSSPGPSARFNLHPFALHLPAAFASSNEHLPFHSHWVLRFAHFPPTAAMAYYYFN